MVYSITNFKRKRTLFLTFILISLLVIGCSSNDDGIYHGTNEPTTEEDPKDDPDKDDPDVPDDPDTISTWEIITDDDMDPTNYSEEGGVLLLDNLDLGENEGEGDAYSNVMLYREIQVEKGVYKLSADVFGNGATGDSWFEFYVDETEPQEGVDYAGLVDEPFLAMGTEDEVDAACLEGSFEGNINELACYGFGLETDYEITFEEDTVVYIVVRAGSWAGTLGEGGINIVNVELVKQDGNGDTDDGKNGDSEGQITDWNEIVDEGMDKTNYSIEDNVIILDNSDQVESEDDQDAYSNVMLYSKVTLAPGIYKLSAQVSGDGAVGDSWFEFYVDETEPQEGVDYAELVEEPFLAMGTKDEVEAACLEGSYDGDINELACYGFGLDTEGEISFDEETTIYVVIRAGSWAGILGNSGISVERVKLEKL